MPLVTTTEMFEKAYKGGYAIGAFNVNNMEIIQGITEAAMQEKSPVILQVSAGARKYAKHNYLVKLVEAALLEGVGLARRALRAGVGAKIAAVLLAVRGELGPVAGALVHNAGSVLVILNSAFLLFWKSGKDARSQAGQS